MEEDPSLRISMRFEQPASVADTIEAMMGRVEVQVVDGAGDPAAGTVVFSSESLTLSSDGQYVPHSAADAQLDDDGMAAVWVRLGRTPGPAFLLAAFGNERDSLRFDVRPGAHARWMPEPAEHAIAVGGSYTVTTRAGDRYGNSVPGVVHVPTARSLTPDIVSLDGTTIRGVAPGLGVIELTGAGVVDTARASVVPPGELALIGDEGVVLWDIEQAQIDPIAGEAACPSWHPDGTQLVLRGLMLLSPGGAPEPLLTDTELLPGCGTFTRDGQWIFFEGGPEEIWRVRPDGSDLERIVPHGEGGGLLPAPAPDGSRVAYVALGGALFTRLVVRDIAAGTVDTISGPLPIGCSGWCGTGGIRSIDWSPDGEWIAYTEESTEHFYSTGIRTPPLYGAVVRLVRPDGSETRAIAPPGAPDHFHAFTGRVRWSPDGEWLVGKAFRDDLRIHLLQVATGNALPLHYASRAYSDPDWRP